MPFARCPSVYVCSTFLFVCNYLVTWCCFYAIYFIQCFNSIFGQQYLEYSARFNCLVECFLRITHLFLSCFTVSQPCFLISSSTSTKPPISAILVTLGFIKIASKGTPTHTSASSQSHPPLIQTTGLTPGCRAWLQLPHMTSPFTPHPSLPVLWPGRTMDKEWLKSVYLCGNVWKRYRVASHFFWSFLNFGSV